MTGGTNLKAWLFTAIFLLVMVGLAQARTINVGPGPGYDFNSIQLAIDDSNDGDTIIVQPGVYTEYIIFHGKNITLTSTNPSDFNVVSATIINGSVWFLGTEDPNCMLTGFKINRTIGGDGNGQNHTHATISHCLFISNIVYKGTVIKACDGTIRNCVVTDNLPSSDHTGYTISECHGLIKNCTIARNILGIHIGQEGTTTIENCIIYHNRSGQIGVAGTINIAYSDVDGIYGGGNVNWGPGNMDADPCFVRLGRWEYHEPDMIFFEGNYHLQSEAGRWDPNSQSWVQDDVTSPCIDAGNPNNPVGYEPFPNGGRINMGAYGGTAEASKSYFGELVCETIVAGDINGDCRINFLDFSLMAAHWLEDNNPPPVTTTYVFQPDLNALRISGGFAGQGQGSRSIEGRFELTIDFDAGIAWFNNVDATLSEEVWFEGHNGEGSIFTDSLDVIFNMTELVSTDVSEKTIDFLLDRGDCPGCFPPYTDIHLRATFIENSVHLVGDFCEPCCDGYCFHLDAVAVAEP